MKEIGGYIELEEQGGSEYHDGAVRLNCGRNCLAYLIESKKISKLYIPYYMCSTAKEICEQYNILYEYYHINEKLEPIFKEYLAKTEYIYIVNYYGMFSDEALLRFITMWKNVIFDYAQDFFRKPINDIDTLYTCRKYFGVSDGAYLYTKNCLSREIENDYSYNRMGYLLGRYEKGASEFYHASVHNNESFKGQSIKKMSKLTQNILRGINYLKIKDVRENNKKYIHERLGRFNRIEANVGQGNFMYPLYFPNAGKLRQKLHQQKIYVPILWPEVLSTCNEYMWEYSLAEDILPLPIDQRYGIEDMKYICERIELLIKSI